MSGRQQMDQIKEEWIANKIKSCPQLISDYLLSLEGRLASSTRKAYLGYLLEYDAFMSNHNISLIDVKPMHIDRYISYLRKDKGDGVCIINAKLSAISSFYNFLKINDFVTTDPCFKKHLPIPEKDEVVYMTQTEEKKLKHRVGSSQHRHNSRDLCIITLGCATGLRISEITNIDVDDIDFNNKVITNVYAKGNHRRQVYIEDDTIQIIMDWLKDRESIVGNSSEKALFVSQKKKRISPRTVEEMIQKHTQDLGKHITPHKMRSTCGTRLYNKTGDIYLTAKQLGHKNVKTTSIYAVPTEDKLRNAAKILDR